MQAGSIAWQPVDKTLQVRTYSILPKLSRDSIFKTAPWQTDYITIEGELANISGLQLKRTPGDTSFIIKKILLDDMTLHASRDKRMAFQHGIEKMMPTKLLGKIKTSFHIDSVEVQKSNVYIHEISASTNNEGIIPLQNVHAIVTNVTSKPAPTDELGVFCSAGIGNMQIHEFNYAESYTDSLSVFKVQLAASGMAFTDLNHITVPLASAKIEKGNSDTLFAAWKGNKYAAYGQMDFYYKDIKVKLMNPKDSTKPGIKFPIINWVANTFVLRKSNQKTATAFYVRDREKFVFNYWIKTCMSGVLTSTGIKSNKKYEKQYNAFKQNYTMPSTN